MSRRRAQRSPNFLRRSELFYRWRKMIEARTMGYRRLITGARLRE